MRTNVIAVLLALASTTALTNATDKEATANDADLPARISALEQELRHLKELVGQKTTQDNDATKFQELDQKVRVLQRKQELEKEAAIEKAKTAVAVTAGSNGFTIRSADTNFVLRLRGYIQTDGRFFPGDNAAGNINDSFLIRRARPILEGTVFEKYDFRLMTDFGSGITGSTANNGFLQDAYVNARFLPGFQIQAGKFKEPVGLERLQSGANMLFIERGYPTQLIPNRDVGVQLQGDLFDGTLSYAAGIFNGVGNGGSGDFETADDDKDFAGRLFAHPFKNSAIVGLKGLGFGLAGTFGNQEGSLRALVSPGQQRIFSYRTSAGTSPTTANVVADGDLWRLSPQAYYYWGPFGVYGEYVVANQKVRRDDGAATFGQVRNSAWQVAASCLLTGEENSFKAVTPRKPFSPANGGWGAWELAARYGQLDVDDDAFPAFANPATSATKAASWGVGLNWHLNRNVKLSLDYEKADFSSGSSAPLEKGEHALITRAQVSF
jgi:phosphate-selective porin OprO/OprP